MKKFKFLGFLTCLYITFQLVSDVTAGKIIDFAGFPVSVTVLYFPVTFIFSDILTEVYGYSRARSVLWIVMICSITAGLVYSFVVLLPPASGFGENEAYRIVLGRVPRILIGGWIAIFTGDISNNYVLAKMKIWTKGKMLWTRTIGSTIVGQFVNTVIFYMVGLYGIIPNDILFEAIIAGWIIKVVVEAAFTPLTYFFVNRLKKIEKVDHFDRDTRFNPFILESPF
ncbi:MAG: queuosine precursor transporter [Bacteroidales bacterium]|nr:queuosine precursor transporter [Bacteroidales bacterium]